MSESSACLNAKSILEKVAISKESFEEVYDHFIVSGDERDRNRVHEAKHALEKNLHTLREATSPARMERIFDLRKQYDSQIDFLLRKDFLKRDFGEKAGEYYSTGATWLKTPVPSFEDVLRHMVEKSDTLERKAGQGFTKLLLVPFDMSLQELVPKFTAYLKNYDKDKNGALRLDASSPVWIPNISNNEDTSGLLKYECPIPGHPSEFRTKSWIRSTQHQQKAWDEGWQIILLQEGGDGKGIRAITDRGDDGGGLREFELGKTSFEYRVVLDKNQPDPSSERFAECGMTFETWVFAFMRHLEETGRPLDDGGAGNIGYLIGARHRVELERSLADGSDQEDGVYTASWIPYKDSESGGSVDLMEEIVSSSSPTIGVRTEVRI